MANKNDQLQTVVVNANVVATTSQGNVDATMTSPGYIGLTAEELAQVDAGVNANLLDYEYVIP